LDFWRGILLFVKVISRVFEELFKGFEISQTLTEKYQEKSNLLWVKSIVGLDIMPSR
jgi:hypothetical protein